MNQERESEKELPSSERERGWSPKLEIDSITVGVVPLTADQAKIDSTANLPCFSLPPPSSLATHVTDLPFFSLLVSSKPPQDKWPTMTQSPPPRDLVFAASKSNPVASLSSFFSQFDQILWIFFVWFYFFCFYLLRNDIIYLFGSWENVSNK